VVSPPADMVMLWVAVVVVAAAAVVVGDASVAGRSYGGDSLNVCVGELLVRQTL
jgi:hypothetical protein